MWVFDSRHPIQTERLKKIFVYAPGNFKLIFIVMEKGGWMVLWWSTGSSGPYSTKWVLTNHGRLNIRFGGLVKSSRNVSITKMKIMQMEKWWYSFVHIMNSASAYFFIIYQSAIDYIIIN